MSILTGAASAAPISISILHTNDVHSHFREGTSPLHLGGIARLRTAIKDARVESPNSLLVDGGDWSEGQIYYVEGAGAESIKLMDLMGYDAAVVGNHDWLNGPDRLVSMINSVRPRMRLVGANFDLGKYERAEDFYMAIGNYSIKIVAGVKVAFIGLVNYDPVYASYLAPIKALDPGPVAQKYAQQIKSQHLADIVIGISHNSVWANQAVLQAAPDMDLIIGAHDHAKLTKPVVVTRPGHADAWIVEAGKWGEYLGRVDLTYDPAPENGPASLQLANYGLKQIDDSIPEDLEVKSRVEALEAKIESRFGPIFHDHVADCDDEITNDGIETQIGDLVTDAYRNATGADVAIDQNKLIYGELHQGPVNSVDIFNFMPPIFNPATGKAWTLHTWMMKGSMASTVFRLLYTWRKTVDSGGMSFSGLEVTYDPSKLKDSIGMGDVLGGAFGSSSNSPVHSLTIGGKAIESDRMYKFVAGDGIVQAIKTLNDKYYGLISLKDLTDTGVEDWKAVRDYVKAQSPINSNQIALGGRVQTWQPDLGIAPGSFKWEPTSTLADGSVTARIELAVTNYGATPSSEGATVDLSTNSRWLDTVGDADWKNRGAPQRIPALAPGQTQTFVWDWVVVPGYRGVHPLSAYIRTTGEYSTGNDGMTRYFKE